MAFKVFLDICNAFSFVAAERLSSRDLYRDGTELSLIRLILWRWRSAQHFNHFPLALASFEAANREMDWHQSEPEKRDKRYAESD